MLGQAHHFLNFNRGKSEYAEKRFGDEAKRIYGVLEQTARRSRVPRRRLLDRRHRDLAVDRALRVAGRSTGRRYPNLQALVSRDRGAARRAARLHVPKEVTRSAAPKSRRAQREAAARERASAVVPQHPPTMRAPLAIQPRACAASSAGATVSAAAVPSPISGYAPSGRASAQRSPAAQVRRREGAVHHGDRVGPNGSSASSVARATRAGSRSRRARRPRPTRQLTPSQTGRPTPPPPRTRAARAASPASSRAAGDRRRPRRASRRARDTRRSRALSSG